MKAYVKIQSSRTINVTCGLQNKDVTNPDAHIPDRLKVAPEWPKCTVLIEEGTHWYPSEITEWATVQALQNDGIITIGQDSDEPGDAKITEEKLEQKIESMGETPRRRRKASLETISEE